MRADLEISYYRRRQLSTFMAILNVIIAFFTHLLACFSQSICLCILSLRQFER